MPCPRVKILHVVFSLDPGGMENGLVNVAKALDASRYEVHVCCLNRGGEFVQRLPQPENVYILGRSQGFTLSSVTGLSRLISRIRPHLIHTHNLGPLIYSTLATLGGVRCPILHGEHGVFPPEQCTPKRVRQRKLLYRFCRNVHTVSTGQTQQIRDLGLPESNLVVLINGVDTDRFSPIDRTDARKQIGLFSSESLVIGIVGRLVPLKRHKELIQAFEKIAGAVAKAELLIVGGGGSEADRITEQVNSSPVKDRIHMTGFKADPRPYYQSMDLLAVPSVVEGMSNVVLEAMACGIPVLAHNACGNAEMLEQGVDGVVADLSSVDNLAGELGKMLANPAHLAKMGGQARENVVKKFSLSQMVANYQNLYSKIAGGKA